MSDENKIVFDLSKGRIVESITLEKIVEIIENTKKEGLEIEQKSQDYTARRVGEGMAKACDVILEEVKNYGR